METTPKEIEVIFALLEYITSGRRYQTINPYFVPEVIEGLKLLAEHAKISDILNAKEATLKKYPELKKYLDYTF